MRILLAGKFVPTGNRPIGGLQSWIKTVRTELERLGHTVKEWQPGMQLRGVFHLGIVANLQHTRPALNFCRKSILVSHGIIDAEKPVAGCDVTAFVSEGVRDHWGLGGPIVRQPIDLDFWSPGDGERTHLVRYSYRKAPIHGESVAEALGLEWCHAHGMTHEQARSLLQSAACVLATGRGALEAMACGAPVVLADNRQYQGPLMFSGEMSVAAENSYSGRGGARPTAKSIADACKDAIKAGSQRTWVEENHDSRKIVGEMLSWL